MNWVGFLGINLVFSTLRETLNKKIADKTDPVVSVFYIFYLNTLLFLILHIIMVGFVFHFNIFAILSGVIFTVSWLTYYKAIKISLSQSILFSSYSIVIVVLLSAIYLGESRYFDITKLAGMQVVLGIGFAIIALWYLLHQQKKKEQLLEWRWFVYILLTIITMGIGSFISLYSLKILTTTDIFINQAVGSVPAISILALIGRRSKLNIGISKLFVMFCISVATVGAVYAFYEAARLAPAIILYPVQTVLLVITTMLAGFFIYKEGNMFHGKRLWGLLLGLLGILLLSTVK